MTSVLEHFNGTKGGTVRIDQAQPARNTDKMWKGVPGLDPQAPVHDAEAAARIAAMRCSVWVFGPDASDKPIVGQSITGKWLEWLLGAGADMTEAWMRRQALLAACVWACTEAPESWTERDVLRMADSMYDASVPRRRS